MYINDSTTDFNYDMIIGRDLLKELGMLLDFGTETMIWQDIMVPMKNPNVTMEESYHIWDASVPLEHDQVHNIMDAKYEQADLPKYIGTYTHLTLSEQNELYTLLKEYKDLFDRTLGRWTGRTYQIHLKPGVKPYYS